MAQLVALMSGVVLGGVAEVVGSNLARGKIFTAQLIHYISLDDRYSNLLLNAYINRHAHTEYLKMMLFYSPSGIWHVFIHSINTNIYHFRSMKYRQYA